MTDEQYDVFLSHNGADKAAVEAVALRLRDEARLRPWLDKWHLTPGLPWVPALEQAIAHSKTVAVFFGSAGVSRWHDEEKQLALVCDKPVIPVMLPGASPLDVAGFLRLRTWVDLAQEHSFERLRAGIEGKAPELLMTLDAARIRAAALEGIPPRVAPTRLPPSTNPLFGRDDDLARLDAAWESSGADKTNLITLVAWGGVGKTSMVFEWMNRLGRDGWRGARAVFDWSFYSQGVREQGAPSAEQFVHEALRFFGDETMADSSASAWDKGSRLVELVGQQRTLLVLDGLEPLQHPPGRKGITPGALTDPAMQALLRGLARHNPGLCVVTTREGVQDLASFGQVVLRCNVERLSQEAGVALLDFLLQDDSFAKPAVTSPKPELEAICETIDGHALTLHLLGRYIRRRQWDVRRWQEIRFDKADSKIQGGHAFRMMNTYERWLSDEDSEGRQQLAVLRLLGLFDRPAAPGCIGALCESPAIEGLAAPLDELDEEDWAFLVADLEELGLVSTARYEPMRIRGFAMEQTDHDTGKTTGEPKEVTMPEWSQLSASLDAHPLVREYFGKRLQERNEAAWREGHRRVFEYLCQNTPYWPEGLDGLQLLYQAVAHGCQARGMHRTCLGIYRDRINRGPSIGGFYGTKKLGAFGAEIGAVAWFFLTPWRQPSAEFSKAEQAWLFNQAGYCLRALARLSEAVDPMQFALSGYIEQGAWTIAAQAAGNLSELELSRGNTSHASDLGQQAVSLADRGQDALWSIVSRAVLADALHHRGLRGDAQREFEDAELLLTQGQPEYPMLMSGPGFRYCDLLLSKAERSGWRLTMAIACTRAPASIPKVEDMRERDAALAACDNACERATRALEMATHHGWNLDEALDRLTLGRIALYRPLLEWSCWEAPPPTKFVKAREHLGVAVDGLRRAGQLHYLPRGLLSRAWLHHLMADSTAAAADLDEAEQVASHGPMPIYLADVHLTRARLIRDRTALATARDLLADLRTRGYHRHDDMLADTEAAAEHWPIDPSA